MNFFVVVDAAAVIVGLSWTSGPPQRPTYPRTCGASPSRQGEVREGRTSLKLVEKLLGKLTSTSSVLCAECGLWVVAGASHASKTMPGGPVPQ